MQLPKGSGSSHRVKLWNARTEAESTQRFNQELNKLMGDEGHSVLLVTAGDRTDLWPPTAQVFAMFWVFKKQIKVYSISWGEQQQEAGIPPPHFPELLRRTAAGTGSTNPPCHTKVLSPSSSSLQLWAKSTRACVEHRRHQTHARAHVDGATSSQEGTCNTNSCRTWLCCQARKPQKVFEDESPENIFRFQAQPSYLDI